MLTVNWLYYEDISSLCSTVPIAFLGIDIIFGYIIFREFDCICICLLPPSFNINLHIGWILCCSSRRQWFKFVRTHTHCCCSLRHWWLLLLLILRPWLSRPGTACVSFSQTWTVENKTHLCFSSWPSSVWLLVMASVFDLTSNSPADLKQMIFHTIRRVWLCVRGGGIAPQNVKKTRSVGEILKFPFFPLQDNKSRERVKAQIQDLCSQQTNQGRELQKGGETPFTNAHKYLSLLNFHQQVKFKLVCQNHVSAS